MYFFSMHPSLLFKNSDKPCCKKDSGEKENSRPTKQCPEAKSNPIEHGESTSKKNHQE